MIHSLVKTKPHLRVNLDWHKKPKTTSRLYLLQINIITKTRPGPRA